jgi:hypothetical protein
MSHYAFSLCTGYRNIKRAHEVVIAYSRLSRISSQGQELISVKNCDLSHKFADQR